MVHKKSESEIFKEMAALNVGVVNGNRFLKDNNYVHIIV
jgi:hypothetical protein